MNQVASVNVRIYYVKRDHFSKALSAQQTPNMEINLAETHVLVYEGPVQDHAPTTSQRILDQAFAQLQFEMVVTDWAQAALEGIKRADAGHTSMSVGDIVELVGGRGFAWMVAPSGWTLVKLIGGVES